MEWWQAVLLNVYFVGLMYFAMRWSKHLLEVYLSEGKSLVFLEALMKGFGLAIFWPPLVAMILVDGSRRRELL